MQASASCPNVASFPKTLRGNAAGASMLASITFAARMLAKRRVYQAVKLRNMCSGRVPNL